MTSRPNRLEQTFTFAAAELGMCAAAWLFAETSARLGGDEAVVELRADLGRTFPVLDAVCDRWLAGARTPKVDAEAPLGVARELSRLLIVGLEAPFIDALVDRAPKELRLGLLRQQNFNPNWDRVMANFRGRVETVDLAEFQRWAGPRSGLLTFLYGTEGARTFVLPAWMRVYGVDVRTQFRSLIGWDVLHVPLAVYPRWLVQFDSETFTDLVLTP